MTTFKTLGAAAALVMAVTAPAAYAAPLLQFGSTTSENVTYTAATSNFNITGSQISNTLLFQNLGALNNIPYTVNEEINGGSGVAVTSASTSGNTTALTLGAFTLSYVFATPVDIDGVYVTNLLTLTVGAGTVFDYTQVSPTVAISSWAFSGTGAGSIIAFTSDLLNFANVSTESVTYIFSNGGTGDGNPLDGLYANGSGNFSSNPLPQVPEPVSAALLIVGMTAVGVASRRRRAV